MDRGDFVKKGQGLATLESSAEKAALDVLRARATKESAIKIGQARLELSARSHSRNASMFHKALIPPEKMDEIETTKRLAEMTLGRRHRQPTPGRARSAPATAELARRTLHSPITGVVVERLLAPGEFAHDEQPVLKLAQLTLCVSKCSSPWHSWASITVGQRARGSATSTGQRHVHRPRHCCGPCGRCSEWLFGVRLELPNRDYHVPAGLKCKIRLP